MTMRIRKLSPRISCVPIIRLSAHHHDEVREPRLSSSMNEFLSKPVNAASLFAKVQYEKIIQFIGLETRNGQEMLQNLPDCLKQEPPDTAIYGHV